MPNHITFDLLIAHFGEVAAWQYLAEIEKAAHIQPRHLVTDPDARLAHACILQDMQSSEALNGHNGQPQ